MLCYAPTRVIIWAWKLAGTKRVSVINWVSCWYYLLNCCSWMNLSVLGTLVITKHFWTLSLLAQVGMSDRRASLRLRTHPVRCERILASRAVARCGLEQSAWCTRYHCLGPRMLGQLLWLRALKAPHLLCKLKVTLPLIPGLGQILWLTPGPICVRAIPRPLLLPLQMEFITHTNVLLVISGLCGPGLNRLFIFVVNGL